LNAARSSSGGAEEEDDEEEDEEEDEEDEDEKSARDDDARDPLAIDRRADARASAAAVVVVAVVVVVVVVVVHGRVASRASARRHRELAARIMTYLPARARGQLMTIASHRTAPSRRLPNRKSETNAPNANARDPFRPPRTRDRASTRLAPSLAAMPSPDGVDHTEVIVHARDAADAKAHASSRAGVVVVAKDLTYEVASFKDKGVKARLLSNVNGLFNPGEMTALLGPSGSGKTTFLDVLAGRKTVGETTGEVLFGGKAPSIQFLRRHTGYVEQFDTLIAALTVREMLCYTAELKRPMNEPLASKETAVDKLLRDLGLWDARDVVVGSQMVKGISGGQAKRTNIAIALITDPSVLFLDEPTSGLDSFTANEVMSVVKSLVTDEVTILATIHSPTAYAFSLFDNAMILCGGRQARSISHWSLYDPVRVVNAVP
jgi:ABC-type multidrug transport system ATPase subunit